MDITNAGQGNWESYQRLVISEVDRMNKRQNELEKEFVGLKLEQSRLNLELSYLKPKKVNKWWFSLLVLTVPLFFYYRSKV